MKRRFFARLAWAAPASILLCVPAKPTLAQFTPISQPDAAYLGGTTLIPLSDPDFTTVSVLRSNALTVSIATAAEVRSVSASYPPWGTPPDTESATPRVLRTPTQVFSNTFSFSTSLVTFGLEVQPEGSGFFPVTASFFQDTGTTFTLVGTITRDVRGDKGALLFAASSSVPFNVVGVTVDSRSSAFAVAQLRYSVIPEPGSFFLLSCGLTSLIVVLATRRKAIKHAA